MEPKVTTLFELSEQNTRLPIGRNSMAALAAALRLGTGKTVWSYRNLADNRLTICSGNMERGSRTIRSAPPKKNGRIPNGKLEEECQPYHYRAGKRITFFFKVCCWKPDELIEYTKKRCCYDLETAKLTKLNANKEPRGEICYAYGFFCLRIWS